MDFSDLLDYTQAQAIVNTLENTELAVWRRKCRTYSQKFSTSLHLCLNGTIPAEEILLAVFEDQLESFEEEKDLDNLLDTIYSMEDPDYERQKKEDLEEFIEKAEKEEDERLAAGRPIHKGLKGEATIPTQEIPGEQKPKELPKSGGINLSYLEREEKGHRFEE